MNWNLSTFTIEAEASEWDSYLQQFPSHSCIRGKPFPLYDAWVEIFGKDRATGHGAVDWSAAAQQTPVDLTIDTEDPKIASYHPTMPTVLPEEEVNQGNSVDLHPIPASATSEKKKRKRSEKSAVVIVDAITNFCSESTASLKDVTSRLGAAKVREICCMFCFDGCQKYFCQTLFMGTFRRIVM